MFNWKTSETLRSKTSAINLLFWLSGTPITLTILFVWTGESKYLLRPKKHSPRLKPTKWKYSSPFSNDRSTYNPNRSDTSSGVKGITCIAVPTSPILSKNDIGCILNIFWIQFGAGWIFVTFTGILAKLSIHWIDFFRTPVKISCLANTGLPANLCHWNTFFPLL